MGVPAAVPAAVAWVALVVAARRWGRRGRPPPQDQAAVVFLGTGVSTGTAAARGGRGGAGPEGAH